VEPQPLQSIFFITENAARAVLPANRLLAKAYWPKLMFKEGSEW